MEFNRSHSKNCTRIRILSLGNTGTGKSCLIKRYCEKRFTNKYVPTVGVDYGSLMVDVDGRRLSVHFFDTSGRPIFKDVRTEFYNDIQAVLLTYDVNDKSSFMALDSWLAEVAEYLGLESEWRMVVVVCGTRTDMCSPSSRQVSESEGQKWAERRSFAHVITSAALGLGVSQAFYTLFVQTLQMKDGSSKGFVRGVPNDPEAAQAIHRLLNAPNDTQKLGLLCSDNGISKDQVNRAYRKLASLVHPDKCKMSGAEEAFKALNRAKNALLKICT